MRPHRFRITLLQAMIMVPVLGVLSCFVFLILGLGWASTFGDYPWGRWTVLDAAGQEMEASDPNFRITDYQASIRSVGGRDGAWEISFVHNITRQRRCLRWINSGLLYGYSFEKIDCPTVKYGPGG
jgi:hypothetical protein